MRRERDREVAAAVRVGRSRPRQREDRARGEPLEIARVERRVGRDDDHAGPVSVRERVLSRRSADRREGGRRSAAGTRRSELAATPARRRSSAVRRSWSAPARRPSTCPSPLRRTTRDDVPMPPFQPNAIVPVPAPTAPSATAPVVADVIADVTCSRVTCRPRMSLSAAVVRLADERVHRAHVLVAGLRERPAHDGVDRRADRRACWSGRSASRSCPSSSTCVDPASLPNALPTKTAPGTFSRKRLPPCGRMAVTPVRTVSPWTTVVWPTATPATSVIALCGPGVPAPGRDAEIARAAGRDWP